MDSKLPVTGTTIFTVMSELATQHSALNLAQGFPEFEPDPRLIELVGDYMQRGCNQYAPMTGVEALRVAIADKVRSLYTRSVDPITEVTVCSGASEGLFSSIQAVVRPGDEVIVFDPAYDAYKPAVTLAGGITRHVPLISDQHRADLHIDWTRLQEALSPQTRLLILNFPHNPSGAVFTESDLERLAETVTNTSAYLLSDEVYEHIVFDGKRHVSLLEHDELWARTLVVSSFGKTYHATGWKIGYCVAPQVLSAEFRKIHQWNTFATNTPMQHAIADYMTETPQHYEELTDFYQHKRDLFCSMLAESRFTYREAAGTFFQTLGYQAISDEPDVAYAARLTKDPGVASIPVSVFCETPPEDRTLRFCFAKSDATLEKAAEALCRL